MDTHNYNINETVMFRGRPHLIRKHLYDNPYHTEYFIECLVGAWTGTVAESDLIPLE